MIHCPTLQLTLSKMDLAGVLLNVGLIIVLVLVAVLGIFIAKKWWANDANLTGDEIGFSLSSLKRLHAQGKITDEELEIAKMHVKAQIQKVLERKTDSQNPKQNLSLSEKMNIDHHEALDQIEEDEQQK